MASSGHNCVIMPVVKQLEKVGYNGGMMAIIKQLGWVDDRSKMRHNMDTYRFSSVNLVINYSCKITEAYSKLKIAIYTFGQCKTN